MSGSNAISGITLVGALLAAGAKETTLTTILGVIAVVFATINVVGGFLATHRMLRMFRRKEQATMNILINLSYLVVAAPFIFGLKGLAHPRTAVRGNLLGMLLAVVLTLFDRQIISFEWILVGLVLGAGIGVFLTLTVQMTHMLQLVALFNGFGGGAPALVAGAALIGVAIHTASPSTQTTISTAASGLIGAVTFWGSLVAFGKLQGLEGSYGRVFLFSGDPTG